jgi:hypothetical protein
MEQLDLFNVKTEYRCKRCKRLITMQNYSTEQDYCKDCAKYIIKRRKKDGSDKKSLRSAR